tara:strand:- start:1618 stop:1767 length:150 start_codon:yes stop_codon:yes gene_type:complete
LRLFWEPVAEPVVWVLLMVVVVVAEPVIWVLLMVLVAEPVVWEAKQPTV